MKHEVLKTESLKNLHKKGNPLILYNIWDAGGAKVLYELGAKAIATSSLAVAKSQGFEDGEKIPLNLVLDNFSRIIKSVDVPITVDFEGGYGVTPHQIEENIKKIVEIGVSGLNIEDKIVGSRNLYSIQEQCERIAAIRKVSGDLFINARTDLFFEDPNHNEALVEKALERAIAYQKAGADCFFVPKLKDAKFIKMLCDALSMPVNALLLQDGNEPIPKELIEAGVSRISYGPMPYSIAIKGLQNAWSKILSSQSI